MFFSLEQFAIFLGVCNAVILLIKPVSRLHSRLDVIEVRLSRLEAVVDKEEEMS